MKPHTCFENPAREDIVILRKWHVYFCQGNHCAAALLSYFDYWHSIKLEQTKKSKTANDVAEMHGDNRSQDESLFQFHSNDELQAALLGIYGKTKIYESLKYLVKRNAISIHRNPNPRYKFDNTNHFLLNTKRLEKWLKAYKKHVLLKMNSRRSEISDGRPEIVNGRLKTGDGRLKTGEQYPLSSSVSTPMSTTERGSNPPAPPENAKSNGAFSYNADMLENPGNYSKSEIYMEAGHLAEIFIRDRFAVGWERKTGQPYIPGYGDASERALVALFETCIQRKISLGEITRRLDNFLRSDIEYYRSRQWPLAAFVRDFNELIEPKKQQTQKTAKPVWGSVIE